MVQKLYYSFLIVFILSVFAISQPTVSAYSEQLPADPYSATNATSTADATITRVLVDKALRGIQGELLAPDHTTQLAAYLADYNFSVSTNLNKTIVYEETSIDTATQIDLSEFDILIVPFPQGDLASDYIADILDFVNDGGGLLLGGISNKTQLWYASPHYLNPLSESFGVEFNSLILPTGVDRYGVNSVLQTTDFIAHEIWNGVSSMVFEGCSLNITGTQANATSTFIAAKYGETWNTTAVASSGTGRVFFTGSYHKAFGSLNDEALTYPATDHWQFVLNVMNWLAQNPQQTAQREYPYKIYLHDGPALTSEELAEYNLYVGSMHTHVDQSNGGIDDGSVAPIDRIDQAESIDLDFIVATSHTYGLQQELDWATMEAGGFFMRERAIEKNYHVVVHVGSEVSGNWAHLVTFPYTAADEGKLPRVDTPEHYAEDITSMRERHDVFTGWAHPTIISYSSYPPQVVYEMMKSGDLPIDAIESQIFDITATLQLQFPFYAASDAHSYYALNRSLTYVFAKSRSTSDLIDALRNRRVVGLLHSTFYGDPSQLGANYLGDRVWVDELFSRIEESRTTLNTVQADVDARNTAGEDVTDALAKMNLAWRAFNQLSPSKAKGIADSIDFVAPTIDQPADISYEKGTTGNVLTWNPADAKPATYEIFRDATSIVSDSWNGSAISLNVDGLGVGSYNYTLVVFDVGLNSKADTVIVKVTEPSSDSSGFHFAMILLGLTFLLLRKRQKRR
ncbi:MAG: hypothetical protein ACE5OZ_06795 [Candidatus Heimdallarchaeota archaeon]